MYGENCFLSQATERIKRDRERSTPFIKKLPRNVAVHFVYTDVIYHSDHWLPLLLLQLLLLLLLLRLLRLLLPLLVIIIIIINNNNNELL